MAQDELKKIREQVDFLIEVGRLSEAKTAISKGLSIAPDDYDLLCNMSRVFNLEDSWKESLNYAQRAITIAPDDSWAYILHSSALSHLKRYKEAIKSAQEAIRILPNDSSCWHALAFAQYHAANKKESRAAAEKMLELSPESHLSHQMMTLVSLKEGKLDEAEKYCRQELEINPNSYFGLNNLGVVMERRGKKKEAIEYYHLAAKVNPSEDLARSNLKQIIDKYLPKIGFIIGGIGYVALFRIAQKEEMSLQMIFGISLLLLPFILFGIYRWRKHYHSLTEEQRRFFQAENRKQKRTMLFNLTEAFLRIIQIISVLVCGIVILIIVLNATVQFSFKETIPGLVIIIISMLFILICELLVRRLKRKR